jgi:hypothetical protein
MNKLRGLNKKLVIYGLILRQLDFNLNPIRCLLEAFDMPEHTEALLVAEA